MMINNIHLAVWMLYQQLNNVKPLVGHGLKQGIFSVFTLIIDVDPGVHQQFPDCFNVAISDRKCESCCPVICGQVDINIRSLDKQPHQVRPGEAGSYQGSVAINSSLVDFDVFSFQ